MLKKGVPIKFVKPGTRMERVYLSIQDGNASKVRIHIDTRMTYAQVSAALWSLTYCGNIECEKTEAGYRYYSIGEHPEYKGEDRPAASENLKGINSIFNIGAFTYEK